MLSYIELVELVEGGVITGLESMDQVNASSIDVRLGDEIMVESFEEGVQKVVSLRDRDPLLMHRLNIADGFYDLMPGEAILAATVERFFLPPEISCEYKLKSSMARIFLEHLHAGWADSGFNNSVLTLELVNVSRYHIIRIHPGDRIGQMCFFKHTPVPDGASYANRGRYCGDSSVQGIKP